jgi:Rad3-related DNA helicase
MFKPLNRYFLIPRHVKMGWGAVLLAVAGGKVSEGVNFDHHLRRAVFIPFKQKV